MWVVKNFVQFNLHKNYFTQKFFAQKFTRRKKANYGMYICLCKKAQLEVKGKEDKEKPRKHRVFGLDDWKSHVCHGNKLKLERKKKNGVEHLICNKLWLYIHVIHTRKWYVTPWHVHILLKKACDNNKIQRWTCCLSSEEASYQSVCCVHFCVRTFGW